MKKTIALSVVKAALLSMFSATACAQESPWLVRVRAEHLSTVNKSDPFGGVGTADRLEVSDKTIPELDISYFFSPNIAAELVLTYP